MTKPQRKTLEKLTRLLTEPGQIPVTKHGNIRTGCNTAALAGLHKIGAISYSQLYLRGYVSPDIKIHHVLTPDVDR